MRQLKPNVYFAGAIDWDRRLFDELIPLPDGTSYNAYLVRGSEKTALHDTVDPDKTEILLNNLVRAGVDKLDYVIAHHGEQDHSGSLPDVLRLYPDAKVVTNPKCKQMLIDLLSIEDDNNMRCRTTEKGLEFLNTYHRLRWLLYGKDNDFLLMRLLEQMKRKEKAVFYVS